MELDQYERSRSVHRKGLVAGLGLLVISGAAAYDVVKNGNTTGISEEVAWTAGLFGGSVILGTLTHWHTISNN